MMSRKLSVAFLVLASVCWSLTGMLIKYIPWSSWAVSGWRSLFSAAFLWLVFRRLYPSRWRLDPSASNLAVAVFYSAFTTFFAVGSKLTTSANTVLLQYSAPVWVALLGPLIVGERAGTRDRWLIAMTLAGLSILLLGPGRTAVPGGNEPLGLLAASGGGFCWAMAVMLMRRKGAADIPLCCLVLGNLATVAYSLPAMASAAAAPDFLRNLFFAAVLGVGPLGLGYVFWVAALGRVTALEATLIPSIEPLLNPAWTFLVIGEIPGRWTVAGGAVVLRPWPSRPAPPWRGARARRPDGRGRPGPTKPGPGDNGPKTALIRPRKRPRKRPGEGPRIWRTRPGMARPGRGGSTPPEASMEAAGPGRPAAGGPGGAFFGGFGNSQAG